MTSAPSNSPPELGGTGGASAPTAPSYEPGEFWDEMFQADGQVRPHYAPLARQLAKYLLEPQWRVELRYPTTGRVACRGPAVRQPVDFGSVIVNPCQIVWPAVGLHVVRQDRRIYGRHLLSVLLSIVRK